MVDEVRLRIELQADEATRQTKSLDEKVKESRTERREVERTGIAEPRPGGALRAATAGAVIGGAGKSVVRTGVSLVRTAIGGLALADLLRILSPIISQSIQETPGVPDKIKDFVSTALDAGLDSIQNRIAEVESAFRTLVQGKELAKAFAATGQFPSIGQAKEIGGALFEVNKARSKFRQDIRDALIKEGVRNITDELSGISHSNLRRRLNRGK